MTNALPSSASSETVGLYWAGVGVLAALPFVALQVIYLSAVSTWIDWLVYAPFLILSAVVGFWVIYAVAETRWRRRFLPPRQTPWFALVGLVFLGTFFSFASWVRPLVLEVPEWCRVSQMARWESSRPRADGRGHDGFILVVVGRGNAASHRFTSGWLNWTGPERAGLSSFKLSPEKTFSSWTGYEEQSEPLTISALRDRVARTGLPPAESDRLADDMWDALDQAVAGRPVTATGGTTEGVGVTPFRHEDAHLGGLIWIILLVGSFQVVARISLPPREPSGSGRRDGSAG